MNSHQVEILMMVILKFKMAASSMYQVCCFCNHLNNPIDMWSLAVTLYTLDWQYRVGLWIPSILRTGDKRVDLYLG